MYVKFIVFIFILTFSSCKTSPVANKFFEKTNLRWNYGVSLSWENMHYKNSEKVEEPKGTYQAVFSVKFLDKNFNYSYDCINYLIPTNEVQGELSIIANPDNVHCSKLIAETPYAKIEKIRNFGYEMKGSSLLVKVDEYRFEYNFLNFSKKFAPKLLSSSVKPSIVNGIQMASSIYYTKPLKTLNSGDICFDIDEKCDETISNKCSQCSGGHYEVVASSCATKRRKICGVDDCGKKNKPACFRGYLFSNLKPENYCISGSPVGFCERGLKVVCINSVLMCE